MAPRTGVGIDVGGTKVLGVLVGEDGSVLREDLFETPAEDVAGIMETIYRLADILRDGADPVGVGVGAAGMVDFGAGMIRSAPNLAWRETPIRDLVEERTGLPCVVDNDANAATWAEYRFGAGRGYAHLLVVTVGTGIGGGIVADGALSRGAHGFAAEIGHFIVEPGGPWCGCGNRGCWEQVASGQALDRLARRLAEQRPDSRVALLAGHAEATGLHVWEAARAGDRAATQIIEEIGRRLGEGIAGLVNVLDPEAVVVGGGVAEIGSPLFEPARRAFLGAVEAPGHRPEVPIIPAALGNRAGAIGAAALALDRAGAR
ncbi:MAG TPA: ROK family glucokinase [Actinomycetota bacterium]|nr:ROK family glucokinase [Actinomycetota bacterium]